MDKESFIKELTKMSKDDIAKLIKEKGKEPKKIPVIVFYSNTECI